MIGTIALDPNGSGKRIARAHGQADRNQLQYWTKNNGAKPIALWLLTAF